jgi:hypothetical protein
MAVASTDRPIDALRDETVEQLIASYGRGELSLEAFQRRLDAAFEAEQHDTLLKLVEDLESRVDARLSPAPGAADRTPWDDRDEDGNEVEYLVDVFGGSTRAGRWRVPPEVRAYTVFGGTDIDFSEATFTSRTTRVKLLCLFGGVDIYVPEGVNTTIRAFAVFGGIDDKTPGCRDADAPRLVVEGLVMFGGADIRIRRSLKERVQALAERMRGWFDEGRR